MPEANTGVVEIDDFEAEVIETMIDFVYNEEIQEKKKITTDLLHAADKYNLTDLVEFCINHFMSNFTVESVLDIILVAHHINQKELLDSAMDFFIKTKGM